jgi:hypothetical protein
MAIDIAKRRADRWRVMRAIFDAADGIESEPVRTAPTIQQQLELSDRELQDACDYLAGEGLIVTVARVEEPPVHIAVLLTHRGVLEMEQSLCQPDKSTAHLPPATSVISIHNSTIIGSPIQSASPGGHQTTSIGDMGNPRDNDARE